MTPNEIREERDKASNEFDDALERLLDSLNSQIWSILLPIIFTLETSQNGRIKFTVSNINKARSIGFKVDSYNQVKGGNLLTWIVRRTIRLFKLNTKYFKASNIEVSETREQKILSKLMRLYGYDINNSTLDPKGYFAANLTNVNQGQIIADRIRKAIASRQGLNDFAKQFRQEFNTPNSPLSAQYHYRRFTRDFFQEHDRLTQLAYAEELKLKFALYSHTIIRTSRCFCRKRSNRIYEVDFARGWNSRKWRGKKPGVDVMIAQGGYNCRGTWSFMSDGTAKALEKSTGRKINSYNKVLCIE
jgi:hypothetical protein